MNKISNHDTFFKNFSNFYTPCSTNTHSTLTTFSLILDCVSLIRMADYINYVHNKSSLNQDLSWKSLIIVSENVDYIMMNDRWIFIFMKYIFSLFQKPMSFMARTLIMCSCSQVEAIQPFFIFDILLFDSVRKSYIKSVEIRSWSKFGHDLFYC